MPPVDDQRLMAMGDYQGDRANPAPGADQACKPGTLCGPVGGIPMRWLRLMEMVARDGETQACKVHPVAFKKELEAAGLIERVRREGAQWPRFYNVRLTEAGRAALDAARPSTTPSERDKR